MRVYCDFSQSVLDYLKLKGVDVSRVENLLNVGYNVYYIHYEYFNGAKWKLDGIDGIHHKRDGFLLDNDFIKVTESDFIKYVLSVKVEICLV